MNIREFRDAVEHLGRFADVSERAKDPADRVFIRSTNGVLTMVAGTLDRTVRVETSAIGSGDGKALVPARLFLQAGKALRGKGEVAFDFDGKGGATLSTSVGGKVVMPRVAQELPEWQRPSRLDPLATASVPAGFWPTLARLVEVDSEALQGERAIAMRVEGSRLRLTWAHRYVWVSATLPLTGEVMLANEAGGMPIAFASSLRGLDDASELRLHLGPMHVVAGPATAVTFPVETPTYLINEPDVTNHVTVGRKALTDAVKALPNPDEYKRVTLHVGAKTLTVTPYSGLGSIETPCRNVGRSDVTVSLVTPRLLKLLAALPGDEVTIGLDADNDAPVSFKEGHEWRVYLAPVRR